MDFIFFTRAREQEEKRGEKFAKFSQYRMKALLFIMQTLKVANSNEI